MPSSHFYQLNQIMELITLTRPNSILDVGIGFGKYGYLCREYLELLDGRQKLDDWQRRIDGIEIFERYITPLQEKIYDHIYPGDALDILPGLSKKYDLILLIDVIEHFEYAQGDRLLRLCLQLGKNAIVSTPKFDFPQSACFGNPFERHKSFFKKNYFKRYPDVFFAPNFFSTIAYLGKDAKAVHKKIWQRRLFISLPARIGLKNFSAKMILRAAKPLFEKTENEGVHP